MSAPSIFDRVIERRGTDSMKWARYAGRGIVPMWVADMDFAAPPAIIAALQLRVAHEVFGYALESAALNAATVAYVQKHYGWQIDTDWLVWLPGLVTALNVACHAVEGGAFTATPIYPPFMSAPAHAHRALSTEALINTAEGWRWDFDAVEAQLATSGARLWLLCHPHNPVGRAWTREELDEIARLAREYDVVVCSDEVHCDLLLNEGAQHTPFALLNEDAALRSITLMAPSKTYNIAGLGAAFAIIPDATLRQRFKRAMQGIVPHINVLGLSATETALTQCEPWRQDLLAYLRGNAQHLQQHINALPGLTMHPVEATYLAWIDARGLCETHGLSDAAPWFEAAGVGPSAGRDFDKNGAQDCRHYVRLNFGCPRATLNAAIERIQSAYFKLPKNEIG